MANEWMNDARKIPDETMSYLRKLAIRAIKHKGYSTDQVADVLRDQLLLRLPQIALS
jgi:hypothetical protein